MKRLLILAIIAGIAFYAWSRLNAEEEFLD
jgi:hypothetical protein